MSDRFRVSLALGGAVAILFLAGWLDGQVFEEIRRRESSSFDVSELSWAMPFGSLAVASGVLAVGGLAWWARSLLVGVAYAVVGAFFAFLFTINWQFAAGINDAPPVLPQPISRIVNDIYFWGAGGSLNAYSTIGAAMLLAGLATIALVFRRRNRHPALAEPVGDRQRSGVGPWS